MAQFSRHIDGQIVRDPAVHQQLAIQFDRYQRARNRHAGAHGFGQIAGTQHDRVAGGDIGRDGPVRHLESIEVVNSSRRQCEFLQQQQQVLALQQSLRQLNLAALDADRGVGQ